MSKTIRPVLAKTLAALLPVLIMPVLVQVEVRSLISANELLPGDAFSVTVPTEVSPEEVAVALGELQIPLSSCAPGLLCGIGVIPPKTGPGKIFISVTAGGEKAEITILVKKPDYPERHIKLPGDKVDLSEDDLVRIKKEANRLKAIWDMRTPRQFAEGFSMPLPNPVGTGYGVKRIFNRKKTSVHQGVDIKGSRGEEIKASNRGVVIMADDLFFGGNTIILDHGAGIFTVYMHLAAFSVKPGSIVEKGQAIGLVGSTGRSSGPHLHFGLKIMNISANPLSIIGMPVR